MMLTDKILSPINCRDMCSSP